MKVDNPFTLGGPSVAFELSVGTAPLLFGEGLGSGPSLLVPQRIAGTSVKDTPTPGRQADETRPLICSPEKQSLLPPQ